jgi:hypothetical protein
MPNWTTLEWLTAIASIAAVVGLIFAYLQWRKIKNAPSQNAGHRGVNVGGDNGGDINTGSQARREK